MYTHAIPVSNSIFEFRVIASITTLCAGFIYIVKKVYSDRSGISKYLLFAVIWFLVTLSPTSTIFPTTSILVENRMYLSGFSFCIGVVLAYLTIFKVKIPSDFAFLTCKSILLASIVHIGLFCFLTWKRNAIFGNPIILWEDVISKYPNNSRAIYNLGLLLDDQKEYEKAQQYYQKAIELDNKHAKAYNNLGRVFYLSLIHI